MPIAIQVPGLAHWSDLGNRVARLTQAYPDLAARLIVAPARALHCYAIYLHQTATVDDELLAQTLFGNHPRKLLWADCSPELWTMLERIIGPVWSLRDYERLDALLKSALRSMVLDTKSLNSRALTLFETVGVLDPLVIHARAAVDGCLFMLRSLSVALSILRRMNLLQPDDLEAASLRRVRNGGLTRWVMKRLARVNAPRCPFKMPHGYSQITKGRELLNLALKMRNCLSDTRHMLALATGELVFLKTETEAHGIIVATLARGPGGCWMLEHAEGQHRRDDTEIVSYEVVTALRLAGIDTVELTLRGALARLP